MLNGEDKMNDIEWKEGAVCYAGGKQWFNFKGALGLNLVDVNSYSSSSEYIFNLDDFKLNEPVTGDYIPKSELGTEQKYNDAIEVFGLFGFKPHLNHQGYNNMIHQWRGLEIWRENIASTNATDGRKLTYNQLMAIGKLKRLMNERTSSAVSKVNLDIERAVKSKINDEPDKPMDNVKSPSHYQLIEGVESIEIIARSMTQEQWKGFCLGNMLKYRIRAGKKDALQQDIEKANFYGELYEMHKEKCYG